MNHVSIYGLSELQDHLQKVLVDPNIIIDTCLVDCVQLQLTKDMIPPLQPTLLPLLTDILKTTMHVSPPLISLNRKLLLPLSFAQALTIANIPSLLTALKSPLCGANHLALAIIRKAAKSPYDASILSTLPHVVDAFVHWWIATNDDNLAERAGRVLADLLQTDCEVLNNDVDDFRSPTQPKGTRIAKRRVAGYGRLWKQIMLSRPNLCLIQQHCSIRPTEQAASRPILQVTTSQTRLLRLLLRLCTQNIAALSQPLFPDLFDVPHAELTGIGQGFFQWAALAMIDRSDRVMKVHLSCFFETLVGIMWKSERLPVLDSFLHRLVKAAVLLDTELETILMTLPDRADEERAEPFRAYVTTLLR